MLFKVFSSFLHRPHVFIYCAEVRNSLNILQQTEAGRADLLHLSDPSGALKTGIIIKHPSSTAQLYITVLALQDGCTFTCLLNYLGLHELQ